MNRMPCLPARLQAISDLIRERAGVVLDIGTDHALLPIYLTLSGKADRVIASDIAEKPLERARDNLIKWGAVDKVTLHLGNGLCGLESYGAGDIVIAGMGGEMIGQIISVAPFVRNPDIHLILQPMTRAEVLRKWLGENGFQIKKETLVLDEKLYQIMLVFYDGVIRHPSPYLCAVGEGNLTGGSALLPVHLSRLYEVYSVRREGKLSAGIDASEETAICASLRSAMEERV